MPRGGAASRSCGTARSCAVIGAALSTRGEGWGRRSVRRPVDHHPFGPAPGPERPRFPLGNVTFSRRGRGIARGAGPLRTARTPTAPPLERQTLMKIGIIGAGNIGGNLTRRLTALGHKVSVANSRGPQTLTALAEETGATPVTVGEAARGARIVVVTIPLKAIPDLPAEGLFDGAAEGFAVIDTGNYYPRERDGRIAGIEDEGLTESRWTERHLGHPVVKAFNGTYAQDILDRHRPAGDAERLALPVAGDDEEAKKAVRELIDELGFDTVDAGGIDDSWRQQPDTPVYGLRGGVEAVERALAEASPERPASFRG
ncbi:NAD(P)-binding domain-containing protein [Streptomyces sp. NPDC048659]|uniref:NADPH-dependent F420 reductase n=1 Tax=Streptomyces sp. NPDC048659 TaxID=3155489 RepID=UPI0034499AD0